jgi:transposase
MAKPIFKAYQQNQTFLFPASLEEMIAFNHPVRVVSEVIDNIDIDIIIKKYRGGTSSYHPRMLLKILVYSYLNNIYSSRRMESICEGEHLFYVAGRNESARSPHY